MKNLLLLIVLFLCFSTSNVLKATHATGLDLTYECIGSGNYLLKLTVFQDCSGNIPSMGQQLKISGCGLSYSLSLTRQNNPVVVSQLCTAQLPNSSCNGGNLPSVIGYTYEGTIFLPNSCSDFTASKRMCCRQNSYGQFMYIESKLNTIISPCNNSPTFISNPAIYACVGQHVNYNHSVIDTDGDSLVYSLVDCLQDAGIPITPNPLSTISGVSLDPHTGILSFIPSIVQIATLCVKVTEFRGGVKIGEVTRDLQFHVLSCNNTLPTTGTIINNGQNTGSYDTISYPGSGFCFSMEGGDLDGDTVEISWNNGIPGGTFSVSNNNTVNPVGTFCWTPTFTDVGVHHFVVTSKDDVCPIAGVFAQAYTVSVIDTSNFNKVSVATKVYLEGGYNLNGLHSDDLRTNGHLPMLEPYSALGYSQIGGGGEMIDPIVLSDSGPDAIVDWVFIELRHASDNTLPVATRSALIQADGDVVDIDGVSGVDFTTTGIAAGSYWIVVRHRSHLDIMSTTPVMINGTVPGNYNFTTLGAFGGGIKILGNGSYAMYDGDVNNDGLINAADRTFIWNARNQTGYLLEDTTLDGVCDAADRSQAWNNKNQQSFIP